MNSPLVDLPRQCRLIRKELRESLRDRRTILTLVLMPLLLYPLLALAFQTLIVSKKVENEAPTYRIGFVSRAEAKAITDYWNIGQKKLEARHGAARTEKLPNPTILIVFMPCRNTKSPVKLYPNTLPSSRLRKTRFTAFLIPSP